MNADLRTIARVTHRPVAPWVRDGMTRTLLRRRTVVSVAHGHHELQVVFLGAADHAAQVLDDVLRVTRFPVESVAWEAPPASAPPPGGQPP